MKRSILHSSNLTKYLPYCCIIAWVIMTPVLAQDEQSDANDNGGFMELNVGLAAFDSRFVDAPKNLGAFANLRINYRWHGFFIENKGYKGLGKPGLGYNFYDDTQWALDIYLAEVHEAINSDENGEDILGDAHDGLTGLTPRYSDDRLGLRATRYFEDDTAIRLYAAPVGKHGPYWGVWYGKTWQVQNFNFHAIASAQYFSRKSIDYYYCVHEQDNSEKFTLYQGRSGILTSAEIGVTYPLSKDWLLESSFKLTKLPASVSPFNEAGTNVFQTQEGWMKQSTTLTMGDYCA